MLHNRSGSQAGLMPAVAALPVPQLAPFELVSAFIAATRALEPLRPTRLNERRLALGFRAVGVHEVRKRQPLLKLNSIDRHDCPFPLIAHLYRLDSAGRKRF